MRIGFVTQLLWDRYGPFWTRLLADAGAQILLPGREATLANLKSEQVQAVPGRALQLAVAQALSLSGADLIIAPELNPGSDSQRGAGQDPWIADFPGAVAALSGLPQVQPVPAHLDEDLAGLVVAILHRATNDPGRVRRLLDRHKNALRPPRRSDPAFSVPGGRRGVAFVAQPWLLTGDGAAGELLTRAAPPDAQILSPRDFDPLTLRLEGQRVDPRAIPTDQEALGAAHLFTRRGGVEEIHLIVDATSGSDSWLHKRVERLASKPLVVHELGELLGEEGTQLLLAIPERN